MRRFFLQTQHAPVGVEFGHAIALGITDRIGEDRGALDPLVAAHQLRNQIVTMEEVVAQDEGCGRPIEKLGADQEGLRQTIGGGLNGVGDLHSPA